MESSGSGWALPDPRRLPPSWAGRDLIAVGADLAPATLLAAYRLGLFPMRVAGELGWWSPDPRGVIPLDGLHVSRSLARSLRRYRISVDECFDDVVAGCADARRPGEWITPAFRRAYGELHRLGWAHSVEVWSGTSLVGGLYGVSIGGLFAGESMFHRATDASKVALVALVDRLHDGVDDRLLDVQWVTVHLASLGAVALRRRQYLRRLDRALLAPSPVGISPRDSARDSAGDRAVTRAVTAWPRRV